MATIAELRKTISERKTQTATARQQAQKQKESIPKTTQRSLRENASLQGRQQQRGLAKQRGQVEGVLQQITGVEKETVQAEKQLEEYLRTPSGIIQYAKETGIKPKVITGKLARGYAIETLGYEYNTPYGTYTDWSPKEKLLESERKLAGLASKGIQEMGFTSDKAFYKALEEGKLSESQIRRGGINPQALQKQIDIRATAKGETPGKLSIAEMGKGLTIIEARDYSAQNLAMRRKASGLPATPKITRVDKTADVSGIRNLQLDSSGKSLNNVNASRTDGNINVSTGVSTGSPRNVRTLVTGMVSSIIGDKDDKEKGRQDAKSKEIFVPGQAAYVPTEQVFGEGSQQTAVTRPITKDEGLSLGMESSVPLKGNFITTAPSGLGYQVENKFLQTFEGIFGGQTPKEVEAKLLPNPSRDDTNVKVGKYPTLGQVGRDIVQTPVAATVSYAGIAGDLASKGVLRLSEKTGYTGLDVVPTSKTNLITGNSISVAPERNVLGKIKQFSSERFYNMFGVSPQEKKLNILEPITTREGRVITPEQTAKVAGFAAQTGVYVGADIATGGFIDLAFIGSGAIKLKDKESTKEQKMEGLFELGGGLLGVGIRGASKVISKTKLGKVNRFMGEADYKKVTLSEELLPGTTSQSRKVMSGRIDILDDAALKIAEKNKGKEVIRTLTPTGRITGEVVEVQGKNIGRGILSQTDEGLKEVILFGDDIKRVTVIPKEGDGIASLFKGDKLLKESKISSIDYFENLANANKKVTPFKFEKVSQKADDVIQLEVKTPATGNKKVIVRDTNKKISLLDMEQPQSKATEALFIEGKKTVESAKNLERGTYVFRETTEGAAEAVSVGTRKVSAQIGDLDNFLVLKKEVGQKIVRAPGVGEVDLVVSKSDDLFRIGRQISPKVDKQVKQLFESKQTNIFFNPDTKSKLAKQLIAEDLAEQSSKLSTKIPKQRTPTVFEGGLSGSNLKATDEAIQMNIGIEKEVGQARRLELIQSSKTDTLFEEASKEIGSIKDVVYVEPTVLSPVKPTTEATVPLKIEVIRTDTKPLVGTIGITRLGQTQGSQVITDTKVAQVESLISKPTVKLDLGQSFDQVSKTKTAVQQAKVQKFKTVLKPMLKQETKTKTDFIKTRITTQPTKPKQPEPTKIILPSPNIQTETRPVKRRMTAKDLFKVFARKGGQDIEVGKASTQEEAFKLLSKKLKGTLRASGYVEKGGEKVKLGNVGGEFRVSKLDPFRVVQKKSRRLGSGSETREIQFFKRTRGSQTKKKTKKLWGI